MSDPDVGREEHGATSLEEQRSTPPGEQAATPPREHGATPPGEHAATPPGDRGATSLGERRSTSSGGRASAPPGERGATSLAERESTFRIPKAPDKVRELFSRRPTVGVGTAAQSVVTDASDLVKAELALAKAEFTAKATEKGMGAGLFAGAGAMAWLGLQGLLITIGFALALILPAWLSALIVTLFLFLVAGILALVGKKKFATPLSLDRTNENVQQDVTVAKAHLTGPSNEHPEGSNQR